MKKLPIGIQTFSDIRTSDMVYVDKTEYVWRLIENFKYVFLSRPRRFGKSLIITTLKSYFEGKREVFEGLYLAQRETEWRTYPIIKIDFSDVGYLKIGNLESGLQTLLARIGAKQGVSLEREEAAAMLSKLINELSGGEQRVVILVDEYDKPLVNVLHQPELFRSNRTTLAHLYGVLKSHDAQLRFVMLTGISRFAKVGVFSGLNNLYDISLDAQFAGIVGFSQQELEDNFTEYLEDLQQKFGAARTELLDELRRMYNGYSWDGEQRYYNPFSLLNTFALREIDNYWYKTATPTLLYHTLVRENLAPTDLIDIRTDDLTGFVAEDGAVPTYPLLFQTGYLTIDRIQRYKFKRWFHLRYPNEEVERSFLILATAAFQETTSKVVDQTRSDLISALLDDDLDTFFRILRGYFSEVPGRLHVDREAYYHSLMFALFRMLGMNTQLERETHRGRIDAVIDLPDRVYIFEFKHRPKGEAKPETLSRRAIEQIREKQYAHAYLAYGKPIVLVGLGFVDRALHGRFEVFEDD